MTSRLPRRFKVGDFEARPLEGRLIGPNGSQHLQPKIMDVLQCLAENAGEVVLREVLIERVWGDSADSSGVVTRCISELRHHLGDDPDAIRYIQTVPKRGYRLVADVDFYEEGSAKDEGTEPPGAPADNDLNVLASLWTDLKRRNVVRVAVAYLVAAWLLMQVGDLVFSALFLPEWSITILIALLALGFPIALILAWAFQLTPEGVVVDVGSSPKVGARLRRNIDIAIIGGLAAIVVFLGYERFFPPGSDPFPDLGVSTEVPESSIAVLRFLNIGGETYFADGLCEELLDLLAGIRELGVAARTSSWALSDAELDVPTIAEQLDVDYVLEGSVRQLGDRIRVTAQLNDGRTGKHVWSRSFDRQLTTANFFETQSEIARQVVGLLNISLTPESEDRLSQVPNVSFEALELYLQGQEQFRRPHSDETLADAAALFRQSIELAPRFAMAYAGLCDTQLGSYIITRDVGAFEDAERACHRALTLDDDDSRVLAALGGLYLFSGQFVKAEEQLRRSLSDSPNQIDAYADLGEALEFQNRVGEAEQAFLAMVARQPGYWYAHNALGNFQFRQALFEDAIASWTRVTELAPDRALGYNNIASAYYMLGDFEAAAAAYEKSVEIEPYVDNYSNLGLAYFYAGQYAAAAEMQQKAAELRPEDARVWGRLANVYYYSGREQEASPHYGKAIELIEEQLVVNPSDVRLNRFLAVYNANLGNIEEARDAIRRAQELAPQSGGVWFDSAKIALAEDDIDQALTHLERCHELGYPRHLIQADPEFISLRNHERFIVVAH